MANGDGTSVRESSSLVDPPVVFADWLIDLNLPICGICATLIIMCLNLKAPRGTVKEKLLKLDWAYVAFLPNLRGSSLVF